MGRQERFKPQQIFSYGYRAVVKNHVSHCSASLSTVWGSGVLDSASGRVSGILQLRLQKIGDFAHGFLPVQPEFLLVSIGYVSRQIRKHDAPGLWILPDEGVDAYVLSSLGYPH